MLLQSISGSCNISRQHSDSCIDAYSYSDASLAVLLVPSIDHISNSSRSGQQYSDDLHRRFIFCDIDLSGALEFAGPRTPFHLTRQRALRVSLTGPFSFLLHANPLARCAASYSPPNHAARRRRSAPPPRTRSALPPQPAPLHPCSSHYAGLAARCLASTHHDLCRRLPRRRATTFSQPIPFL